MSILFEQLYKNRIKLNLLWGSNNLEWALKVYAVHEYCVTNLPHLYTRGDKQRGLSIFFFKVLLELDVNSGLRTYRHTHGNAATLFQALQTQTHIITYNVGELYKVFYNLFLFFYYSGGCDASFATLTSAALYHEGVSLDYLTYHRYGRAGLLQTELETLKTVDHKTLYSTKHWLDRYLGVDFLFFVHSGLNSHQLMCLTNINTHIVGITTNVNDAFYFDTLIPFEAASWEIQYFFIECALYSYLAGRRSIIKKTLFTIAYL